MNIENLKGELDRYFVKFNKVKVIRAPKRLGLIKARLLGLKHVTAPIVTFLDAHIETTNGLYIVQ
jgi:polypeptide N-acetylgalactosaminyltransferase